MTGEPRWILGSCMTSKNSNPWNVQRGKFLWLWGSLFPRIWGLYTSLGACSRVHIGLELWTPPLLIPDYRIAVIPFFFWGRNFGEGLIQRFFPFLSPCLRWCFWCVIASDQGLRMRVMGVLYHGCVGLCPILPVQVKKITTYFQIIQALKAYQEITICSVNQNETHYLCVKIGTLF